MIKVMRFNTDNIIRGLNKVKAAGEPVARAMAGTVAARVRDKARSAVGVKTGRLRDSYYVAKAHEQDSEDKVVYAISWNHKTAPHGHLVEFGHWTWSGRDSRGKYTRNGLVEPKWVPGTAPLGTAWYSTKPDMLKIATDAGRKRMRAILDGESNVRAGTDIDAE